MPGFNSWDYRRSYMTPPGGWPQYNFAPNVGAPAEGSVQNPTPRPGSYSPAFGGVPGPLARPNPFGDLSALYPNLSGTNAKISQNVMSQLRGELSPDTIAGIEDDAARFGILSGMPGSDIAFRRSARNLGLSREALQNQGIQNYLGSTAGISRTQTVSPELQAEIADRNARYAAAPIPGAAAAELEAAFRRNQGVGGRGGGAITYSGMGGPARAPRPLTEPNYFWEGPTHGTNMFTAETGWGGNLFGGQSARTGFGTNRPDMFDPNWDWPFAGEEPGTGEPNYNPGQYDAYRPYDWLDQQIDYNLEPGYQQWDYEQAPEGEEAFY